MLGSMKRFTFIGISIAIALGFTACQKEDIAPAEQSQESALVTDIFSASLDAPTTRTATADGGATVTWAANDKVYYYSQDGGVVRNFTVESAGSSATITLKREQTDTYYNLVYAGNAEPTFSTKTSTEMIITDGVPTSQNGLFASANVSVARATPGQSNAITFKPVTALVKFTTERNDIKTIVLTSGGSENVAGNITVDPTSDAHTATLSGDGSTSVTVTLDTPAAGTYYINVLPVTYANGLVLTLKKESDATIGTVTASKSIDLSTGGKMINLGNIDSHIVVVPVTTGTAKAKLDGTNEVDVNWVQLWANGPKWATINVGVTDPDATGNDLYGGLYRWGGTNNMRSNTSAGDYHNDGADDLSGDNDTATRLWGSNWRMPTQDELTKLKDNCTWNSFSAGCTITGKGDYASNSIFLPAAGHFDYDDEAVSGAGCRGYYWSSTPDGGSDAWSLYFGSGNQDVYGDGREFGYSVRAVLVD